MMSLRFAVGADKILKLYRWSLRVELKGCVVKLVEELFLNILSFYRK